MMTEKVLNILNFYIDSKCTHLNLELKFEECVTLPPFHTTSLSFLFLSCHNRAISPRRARRNDFLIFTTPIHLALCENNISSKFSISTHTRRTTTKTFETLFLKIVWALIIYILET